MFLHFNSQNRFYTEYQCFMWTFIKAKSWFTCSCFIERRWILWICVNKVSVDVQVLYSDSAFIFLLKDVSLYVLIFSFSSRWAWFDWCLVFLWFIWSFVNTRLTLCIWVSWSVSLRIRSDELLCLFVISIQSQCWRSDSVSSWIEPRAVGTNDE